MFTGLIEDVGTVSDVERTARGLRLEVRTPLARELTAGESLAVNGVCLTVTALVAGTVAADISPETIRATTLGQLTAGTLVNLERPVRADARLGGHFVQGHVDATGRVALFAREGECHRLVIQSPRHLAPYLVSKGSIAVDGISLTIANLHPDGFDVQIIPFTWEHTNLRAVTVADAVNLECDIIGKYVVRLAELARPDARLSGGDAPVPEALSGSTATDLR